MCVRLASATLANSYETIIKIFWMRWAGIISSCTQIQGGGGVAQFNPKSLGEGVGGVNAFLPN